MEEDLAREDLSEEEVVRKMDPILIIPRLILQPHGVQLPEAGEVSLQLPLVEEETGIIKIIRQILTQENIHQVSFSFYLFRFIFFYLYMIIRIVRKNI